MRQNSFRSCSRMRKFPSRVRCNTILSLLCEGKNRQNQRPVKYWEIIADNLSKAGWSWGCVSAVDSRGRTIWIADAHRDDGKRFVVRADEKLTAHRRSEGVKPDTDFSQKFPTAGAPVLSNSRG